MTLLLEMPGGGEWILILMVMGLLFIPKIFYLLTLQSTLSTISVQNRKMAPANVWLLLIPLFNLVWHFNVVKNLSESIKAEATEKNVSIGEPNPAYNLGLAMCILNCLFIIPVVGTVAAFAGFICWIIYWLKIAGYKKLLVGHKPFAVSNNGIN